MTLSNVKLCIPEFNPFRPTLYSSRKIFFIIAINVVKLRDFQNFEQF